MFGKKPAFDADERRFGRGHKSVRAWDVAPEGTDDPPVFVLVHGLGVSSGYFRALTDRLKEHGRVLVFDLPGFGGVPHPDDPMSIAEFARAVLVALADLGVRDPVLVGHSMGAQVVVELVRRAPGLGGRVVLIGPVVRADQRSLGKVTGAFLRSSTHERFGAALASVKGYAKVAPRWVLEILPAVMRYPVEARLAGIGGRLAIVCGEHDLLCPRDWAEDLLETSGAEGVVVVAEGAAHQVVIDNAHEVADSAFWVAGRGPLP